MKEDRVICAGLCAFQQAIAYRLISGTLLLVFSILFLVENWSILYIKEVGHG